MGILAFFGLDQSEAKLSVGDEAPEVMGIDQDGKELDFADMYKDGLTLVYFYPKADTPGCTKQACSIRDAYAKLQENGVKVLGVSTDKPEAQKKFKEKFRLPFTLISDSKGTVLEAFGVPTLMGFSARQAFLIKGGKIVWLDRSASTTKQADDVMDYLNSQSQSS